MTNPLDSIAEKMKAAAAASTPQKTPELVETVQTKQTEPVVSTAPAASSKTFTNEQLLKLLEDVAELQRIKASGDTRAAHAAATKKPDIDWTKITEKDITNLDLDIPVIEQEKPSYMDIHLHDKMYVARWIHRMPARLGVCLSEGYSHIKKEDWDERYPRALQFDESGNYSHGDVIALKILKSRYYPALKANYVKTMAIHGKTTLARAVASGKSSVQLNRNGEEIVGGLEPEFIDPRRIQAYDPGDTPTKGEKEFTRDMIQI